MPKRRHRVFQPIGGTKTDQPDQFLHEIFSADGSQNMEVYDRVLRSRLGLVKYIADAVGAAFMRLDVFQTLDRTISFVGCTTTDIFELDLTNLKPLFRTPTYTTGSADVVITDKTVTGNGTAWDTSDNIKAGDKFRLGTINASDFADQVWYTVASITSDTELELTAAYAEGTLSTQTYTIRKVFTGTSVDYWDACEFTDTNLGRIMVFTNGVDVLHYWTGSGQVVVLGGSPPICRYVLPFLDHLMLAWCVVSGNNQPHQVQWSLAANAASWPATSLEYLVDLPGEINGFKLMGNYAVLVKEIGFYLGRYIGGTALFDFERRDASHGSLSPWSVVEVEGGLYYFGDDLRFHYWNGVEDRPISDDIFPFTRNLDPDGQRYTYGIHIKVLKQVRWLCAVDGTPFTHVVVYNYGIDPPGWQIWEYGTAAHLGVPGLFKLQSDLYVDDSVWGPRYVDEHIGYWDDRSFLANAPVLFYGGTDGYLRQADIGDDDDGVAITSIFRSSGMDYELPDHYKRLHQIEPWLVTQGTGTVTYRARRDDSDSFGEAKSFSLVEEGKTVTKPVETLDMEAHVVSHEFRSTDHWELLGFISHISKKRRRVT